MKANKHEIKGYIYVTSEDEPKENEYGIIGKSVMSYSLMHNKWGMTQGNKIILCNNPNLPIQQLTTEEVEYLKSVDSFEVKKEDWVLNPDVEFFYKILIPQENENEKDVAIWFSSNTQCEQIETCYNSLSKKCICPKEQPKVNIEEVARK